MYTKIMPRIQFYMFITFVLKSCLHTPSKTKRDIIKNTDSITHTYDIKHMTYAIVAPFPDVDVCLSYYLSRKCREKACSGPTMLFLRGYKIMRQEGLEQANVSARSHQAKRCTASFRNPRMVTQQAASEHNTLYKHTHLVTMPSPISLPPLAVLWLPQGLLAKSTILLLGCLVLETRRKCGV